MTLQEKIRQTSALIKERFKAIILEEYMSDWNNIHLAMDNHLYTLGLDADELSFYQEWKEDIASYDPYLIEEVDYYLDLFFAKDYELCHALATEFRNEKLKELRLA